jgi:hypothetical protein
VSAARSGGIFISYRRQEASHLAGRLYDRLADRFGAELVFMDVATIDLGVDFAEVITRAVGTCQVLLAVIGPHWVTVADEAGRPRLRDPSDIVRLEVQAALERGVRVIPILIEGAVMPRQRDLPRPLAGLARRNALTMRHESFRYDADRLVAAIERVLAVATQVAADPQVVKTFRLGREVNGVAFGPDGSLLATASADQTARVWDAASGQERTRVVHDDGVTAVAFGPDESVLATASADHTARIWDALSGQERTWVSHDAPVWAVAFSPDGRLLATGSEDRTARVWDAASGQERARVAHPAAVAAVAFSPDGRQLVTGSFDAAARTWALLG